MPNQLAHENSPYLLQHANNPVNWYPWGEEALEKAKNEKKPIFLSIGYAACHWCHVMEHESFEDESIAALMNEHFINIKVDREERPDLDSIYMAATTALTGSGGWPMSVFLTPDLRPFYAGTYFPPVPRYNMPSFRDLLLGIANAWQNERDEIFRVGAQVAQHIRSANEVTASAAYPLTQSLLNNAADHLVQSYDWGFGGWGQAPKFPQPMTLEFLLSRATLSDAEAPSESRQSYLKTAAHALGAMARGGMYDVVGGGFARYSVDNLWKTPHFEKMLYDNAQLALTYLHGYLLTGEPAFRRVCEETLDFLLREMTHSAGGFYSSLDADSEGEEGKFYVWEQAEIERILGEDFDFFKAAYAITPAGNFEGKTILQRSLDDASLAARFKLPVESVAVKLSECHSRLLSARSSRIRPGTDDKILVSWNALTLTAFAEAGRFLQREDYLNAAIRNAGFLLENLYVNDRLLRSWRAGQAKHNAYLEDYAALILALLALYQSDPNTKWYTTAIQLADEMVAHYSDPQGGFFDTRNDHEALLLRPKDTQDNATPSGAALAANALLRLAAYGDRLEWRNTVENMLVGMVETAVRYPTSFSKWLSAADFALGPTHEIAIIGDPHNGQTQALLSTLWAKYRPRQVTAISNFPPADGAPALLNDRPMQKGLPTAYVCQGFVCQQPVNTPGEFAAQLGDGSPPV
jgi:uncharacterized protein YyaL (SSP411 family)